MACTHFLNRSGQDLERDAEGKKPKVFPWEGALFFNSREDCSGWQFNTEWTLFYKGGGSIRFLANHGGDAPLTFCFSIPYLLFLHFAWNGPLAQRVLNWLLPPIDTGRVWGPETGRMAGQKRMDYRDRELDLSFHHKTFWWSFWMDPNEHRSDEPIYRRGNYGWENILNTLLGSEKFSSTVVDRQEGVVVPMPEGNYKADVELKLACRKRPRWFSRYSYSVEIKNIRNSDGKETGLPHPGKGTASYNCEPDAIMGYYSPGRNVQKAIGALVASCLDCRKRYPL